MDLESIPGKVGMRWEYTLNGVPVHHSVCSDVQIIQANIEWILYKLQDKVHFFLVDTVHTGLVQF